MLPTAKTILSAVFSLALILPLSATATWANSDIPTGTPPTKSEPPETKPNPPKEPPKEEVVTKVPDYSGEEPLPKVKEDPKTVIVKRPEPDLNVYPVHTKSNYCPAGLQPVTISGSISCGAPNTAVTYRQMMTHPQTVRVQKKRSAYHRSAVPSCAVGTKGCTDR
jgi:hypothetical protein